MKQQFHVHLYHRETIASESPFVLFSSSTMGDSWYTYVGPVTVEAEVPDDFDPRAAKIAALRAEKAKLRAAFAARVKELDDRINSLLAIENTVEAA